MGSWRDAASQQAQDDLDLLVGEALERGERTLLEEGTLLPFFLGIGLDEKVTVGSLDDRITAPEMAERLVLLLRKDRARFRACAIVTDQDLTELGTDAIWVDLCHSEGPSLSCYLPYTGAKGAPEMGALGIQPSQNLVWSE